MLRQHLKTKVKQTEKYNLLKLNQEEIEKLNRSFNLQMLNQYIKFFPKYSAQMVLQVCFNQTSQETDNFNLDKLLNGLEKNKEYTPAFLVTLV